MEEKQKRFEVACIASLLINIIHQNTFKPVEPNSINKSFDIQFINFIGSLEIIKASPPHRKNCATHLAKN